MAKRYRVLRRYEDRTEFVCVDKEGTEYLTAFTDGSQPRRNILDGLCHWCMFGIGRPPVCPLPQGECPSRIAAAMRSDRSTPVEGNGEAVPNGGGSAAHQIPRAAPLLSVPTRSDADIRVTAPEPGVVPISDPITEVEKAITTALRAGRVSDHDALLQQMANNGVRADIAAYFTAFGQLLTDARIRYEPGGGIWLPVDAA
jgi:hypothetical protein